MPVDDIGAADLVVVGRVANYRIVLDTAVREKRRKQLENSPDMSPERRKSLSEQKSFLSDYARFDILVDEVLLGKVGKTVSVVWQNSTFSEPEAMAPGPYLIALQRTSIPTAPPGSGDDVPPHLETGLWTMLQADCAAPFMYPVTREQTAAAIKALRQHLRAPKAD